MPCVTFTVTAPPKAAISVRSITASPTSLVLGETSTVTMVFENTGDSSGYAMGEFTVNGKFISRVKTGIIQAGGTATLTLDYTPETTGTFRVCVEVVESVTYVG